MCYGKTQSFFFILTLDIRGVRLNPVLPLVTQFRTQFHISHICTVQKFTDILPSFSVSPPHVKDCWFWSIFMWSCRPTLASCLLIGPSFFPNSVMPWIVFLEFFYFELPLGLSVIISVLDYSLLDFPEWTVEIKEKIWKLLVLGVYCLNRKVSNEWGKRGYNLDNPDSFFPTFPHGLWEFILNL